MDENRFWKIIADACRADPSSVEEWDTALVDELVRLPEDVIVEFDRLFNELTDRAYTEDLWGAACTINCGASEDGFCYFRCWLVGMGRQVYEAALENPDSLADVVIPPEQDAQAEIYSAAQQAWQRVTGRHNEDLPCLPFRHEGGKLKGMRWNINDRTEVRKRFPRLAAIYFRK